MSVTPYVIVFLVIKLFLWLLQDLLWSTFINFLTMILNSLRIASWNIDGCFFRVSGSRLNKLDNDNVLEMIHKVDIAFLVETHCLSTDSLAIKDFDIIQNNRKKHKYAKKGSGGINFCHHW